MQHFAHDIIEHVRSNRGRNNAGLARGSTRNPATRNSSRAAFRFRQKGAHLTFKSHIAFAVVRQLLEDVGGPNNPITWWSFVHERGHADGEEDERYDHTHVAWQWEKTVDKSSPRIFDIGTGAEAIHPHIQLYTNAAHMQTIFDEYHLKEPVALDQSPQGPSAGLSLIQQLVRAPTLFEACEIAGVEVRSVSDIKLLRDDKPLPEEFSHLFPDCQWTLEAPFSHNAYIWGPTGTGKTQWACHQFNKPLVVSTRDALRNFRRDMHDGIVFDDMDFTTWDREELIHLFDWDLERHIRCRYSDAVIPRFTKKIVTSNRPFDVNFHLDEAIGAIRRRFDRIVHVTGPTFSNLPPPLDVPPDLPQEHCANILDLPVELPISPLEGITGLSQDDLPITPASPISPHHLIHTCGDAWNIRADELEFLYPGQCNDPFFNKL